MKKQTRYFKWPKNKSRYALVGVKRKESGVVRPASSVSALTKNEAVQAAKDAVASLL